MSQCLKLLTCMQAFVLLNFLFFSSKYTFLRVLSHGQSSAAHQSLSQDKIGSLCPAPNTRPTNGTVSGVRGTLRIWIDVSWLHLLSLPLLVSRKTSTDLVTWGWGWKKRKIWLIIRLAHIGIYIDGIGNGLEGQKVESLPREHIDCVKKQPTFRP